MEIETEQARPSEAIFQDKTINKKSKPLWAKIIFFAVILLILILLSYFVYNLLNKNSGKSSTNNATKKTTTSSAKSKSQYCSDKQEFISNYQGYSLCFPNGWVKKQLQSSDIAVGFDKARVDDTFPGLISITISDKSENLSIQDIISNSLKFEYSKTTLDSIRGTKIIWDRSKEDPLSAFPKGVNIVLTKYSRTYTISLTSNEADYQSNLELFDSFLSDFRFLKEEPSLPWSESRNILVYYPWPNDTVGNPVDLKGVAIAFEGTVNIRIKDDKNHTLTETTVQAESGTERSAFAGRVSFNKPDSKKGFVEIFTLSPKDGAEQDKVSIPVNFQD